MLATATLPATDPAQVADRKPTTTSDEIRSLARRYRAVGTPFDRTVADILDDAAEDLDYSGAPTWAEHKARAEVLNPCIR